MKLWYYVELRNADVPCSDAFELITILKFALRVPIYAGVINTGIICLSSPFQIVDVVLSVISND